MQKKQTLIDVLDEYGIRTGETLSREEIHRKGKVHRAVRLYLFDKANCILLQRRSSNVDHYSGMWSISVAGHVDTDESSIQALEREIREELGLEPDSMRIRFLFSFRQDAIIGSYIDRQFIDVYASHHDFKSQDINFDREDITEVKTVPYATFEEMVRDQDSYLHKVYGKDCREVAEILRL